MNSLLYREDATTITGAANPAAGFLCLLGFFLHILLSDPLLGMFGFDYSGEKGAFYEKLHPGTLLIFLSFFILLWGQGNPVRQILTLFKYQRIFSFLLLLYFLLIFYVVMRSGFSGIAFLLDTHLTPPMCAIVLCYTPLSYCKKATHLLIGICALNSCIGIVESIGKFRIFSFDPTIAFMREDIFRASALRGHPLNNAALAALACFVVIDLNYKTWLKGALLAIFLISLVAFGGRASLVFTVLGLFFLGGIVLIGQISTRRITLLQAILLSAALIIIPVVILGGLYAAINSGIGERIAAHAKWDDSANSRWLAFQVFDYLTRDEIIFGINAERIIDLSYEMNLSIPLSDIENPWLLMILTLGVVTFPVWFLATMVFIYRLVKGMPWGIKLSILIYFVIASTANSFGRKDSTYLITVCAAMCAARVWLEHHPEVAKRLR